MTRKSEVMTFTKIQIFRKFSRKSFRSTTPLYSNVNVWRLESDIAWAPSTVTYLPATSANLTVPLLTRGEEIETKRSEIKSTGVLCTPCPKNKLFHVSTCCICILNLCAAHLRTKRLYSLHVPMVESLTGILHTYLASIETKACMSRMGQAG